MLFRRVMFLWEIMSGMCISNQRLRDRLQYVLEEVTDPYFTSAPEQRQAEVGKDVSFHCSVENIGTSTLIWKKENRIISAGTTIIRKDKRFSLSGYNLTLHVVDVRDEGEYVCEVETYTTPIRQISLLQVLIPPSVAPHPEDGRYVVRKGSTITLECKATGNPKPTISWSMKGRQSSLNVLGSNENTAVLGEAILLENISREHAGRYECSANNGVGSAALAEISLTVLYTPEIRMERRLNADRYQIELEIFCTVHAEPKPVVRWYKDSMLLDPGTNRIMESNNNRHKLHVLRMGVADLGNYSCMAENSLGKERGFLQISGEPLTPVITSPEMSFKSTEYTLRWNTVSLLVISEYRVLFRLRQAGYRGDEREWTNIIPTVDSPLNTNWQKRLQGIQYSENFTFYDLQPESLYEVMVQAQNTEGWSSASPSFTFSTPRFDVEDRSYLTSTSGVAGPPVMINSGLLRNCLRMLLPVLLFLC